MKSLGQFHSPRSDKLSLMFGAVSCLHAISFSSSSFIEEEHQTWYFLGSTLLFIGFLSSLRSSSKEALKGKIEWILVLILNVFSRRLNQTGDKWINIPDIGDWLLINEFYNRTCNAIGEFIVVNTR